jgi:hypothetical protein
MVSLCNTRLVARIWGKEIDWLGKRGEDSTGVRLEEAARGGAEEYGSFGRGDSLKQAGHVVLDF